MDSNGIIQHPLKFKDTDFPLLARKYRESKHGEFIEWLRQVGERAAQEEYEDSQLDRIERKLDAILNGSAIVPPQIPRNNPPEPADDEPKELASALADLGF